MVDKLKAVRKDYGNVTPLTMDAEACDMAKKMAQLQLNWLLGKYSSDLNGEQYTKDWNAISKELVKHKKLVGVGGYGAYPTRERDSRLGKGHPQMETGTGHEHGNHPCGRGRCA